MYKVLYYKTPRGDSPVKEFILGLDEKTQAKINRHIELLREYGLNLIRPYADVVRGKTRELRVKFSHSNVRIFYFFVFRDEIVLTHGFLKKTQELEARDIEMAERRMADWLARPGEGEEKS